MTQNIPSLEDIAEAGAPLIRDLPPAALKAILERADAHKKLAAQVASTVNAVVLDRYADKIVYPDNGTGTATVKDGDDTIKFSCSKGVDWDQSFLASLIAEIATVWKEDPSEYVKTEYSVAESAYKAWPSDLRAKFEPARTMKPGKVSIKIEVGS